MKMVQRVNSAVAEEDRIRSAYARREEDDPRYSYFNQGHLLIVQQRERRVLACLRRSGVANLTSRKILEVGCGTGQWLRDFIKWGAEPRNILGFDLLPDRASKAQRLCPPGVRIQCASAAEVPFGSEEFDIVLQSTVFTSIIDHDLKRRIAAEMMRVVKPDGVILWYDYHVNNPWNPDVRGIKRWEIDSLFPGCHIELQRLTLLPPLSRWLAQYSFLACYILEKVPLLCTHYLGAIRKAELNRATEILKPSQAPVVS